MDRLRRALLVCLWLVVFMLPARLPGGKAMTDFVPEVQYAVHQDLSLPLRDIQPEKPAARLDRVLEAAPALDVPKNQTVDLSAPQPFFEPLTSPVQTRPGQARMPAPQANFDGISNRNGAIPPDPSGDIGYDPVTGRRYYFQWVNLSYQAWDVSDPASPVSVLGPLNGNQMWSGFSGPCQLTNHGDPVVLFDSLAGRWFVSQFSVSGPYYQCIAVSQTADPTGAWYRYAYLYDSIKMNDYPKFGVWPDGYYMTVNQFRQAGSSWFWAGQGVVVYEREKMLAGLPARQLKFDLYNVNYNYGSLLPADMDGLVLPPEGAPNPFIAWDDGLWYGGQDAIRVWNFHVDWTNLAASTFGVGGNPNIIIPTVNVTPPPSADQNVIPQPNTSYRLDSLGDRLMYRSQYRNYSGYQSLVGNHTIVVNGKAGIHWFELRLVQGGWQVYQEGVYAPDEHSRWMASAAQDGAGNLAIGFSLSSETLYPQIRYTGRLANDPLGTLTQSEVTLVSSTASQTGANRWGDYSMMSVDPADDCTFWYTQQYTAGGMGWKTRIASFRYNTCTTMQLGLLTGQVTDTESGQPLAGVSVKAYGFETTSGADGVYRLPLPPGDHNVTFTLTDYVPKTETVTFTGSEELTLDVGLVPAHQVTVQGIVRDGAGHAGLPVYARVDISNYPGGPVFTDPLTGVFKVTLAEKFDYTLVVSAVSGGYLPVEIDLTTPITGPADPDVELEITMQPNQEACAPAPGYATTAGFIERFTDGAAPAGWLVLNNTPSGQVWQFNNPGSLLNETGGNELFASITDVNTLGAGYYSSLVSPILDFSAETSVLLSFRSDIDNVDSKLSAFVDVSSDGGANWEPVWEKQDQPGPALNEVDISAQAAGKPAVRIRFRASSPGSQYAHTWQVDDVQVNQLPECVTQPGALFVGTVTDANTELPLLGAVVAAGSEHAASMATPLDPALPDGFFQLWVPQDELAVQVTLDGYQPVDQPVNLAPGSATWRELVMQAGQLEFRPAAYEIVMPPGGMHTIVVQLFNTGGVEAPFSIAVVEGEVPQVPQPVGPFAGNTRLISPKRIHEMDASRLYAPGQPIAPAWPEVSLLRSYDSGDARAWGLSPLPDGSLWVGAASRLDLARYDASGKPTEVAASQLPWVGAFGADLAYQPLTGRLWQVNVGGDNCIYELDAASGQATQQKICPSLGASQRGLAFDPLSGTFYSGSWTDGILNHFDASGQLLDSAATGLNLAGLAYHPVSKHLYALVNAADGADVYVLDTTNHYQVLGGFSIPGMTHFGQSGLEFSDDGHLWALDGATGHVFELTVGEPRVDEWVGVSWFQLQPASGSVPPGGAQPFIVEYNAIDFQPGVYHAYVQVTHNTPYPVTPFTLKMTVENQPPPIYYYMPLISN